MFCFSNGPLSTAMGYVIFFFFLWLFGPILILGAGFFFFFLGGWLKLDFNFGEIRLFFLDKKFQIYICVGAQGPRMDLKSCNMTVGMSQSTGPKRKDA